jgi:hypothetical protein
MKIFEIKFIARLREQKDYCSEMIEARNETSALRKFAKMFKIKDYKQLLDSNFSWENESDWLYWFKCISEIKN